MSYSATYNNISLLLSRASLEERKTCYVFTGKERDEETGYGYFGARYMDHELMTMWLSVDPMSDKYPGISPYAYCAWNPVKLVDPNGEDMYPTENQAKNDRALAIKLFGRDNVSDVYNRGTSKNPDYVFNVHSPKSVDSKQPVNAIISNRKELRRYEFEGAPRKNVISGIISLGAQAGSKGLGVNLSSVDLFCLDADFESGKVALKTAEEGDANGSAGASLGPISYTLGYSGGDYIDLSSITNTISCDPIGVNLSNGDVEFGVSASFILGINIKLTSKIIK